MESIDCLLWMFVLPNPIELVSNIVDKLYTETLLVFLVFFVFRK